MDYKKVLRLHYVNKLSSRDIAASTECGKTSVNEFLKRFRDCTDLSYLLMMLGSGNKGHSRVGKKGPFSVGLKGPIVCK